MNNIIDPVNNQKYPLDSALGKNLLKNYVIQYLNNQTGAGRKQKKMTPKQRKKQQKKMKKKQMKKPMNKLVVYDENEHLKHPYHTISFNTSKISVEQLKNKIKNLLKCKKVYLKLNKYYSPDQVDGEIITDTWDNDLPLMDNKIVPSELYNKKLDESRSPLDGTKSYISFSKL